MASGDEKNAGKVEYSSAQCSTSVTPIRTSTALRERECMRATASEILEANWSFVDSPTAGYKCRHAQKRPVR